MIHGLGYAGGDRGSWARGRACLSPASPIPAPSHAAHCSCPPRLCPLGLALPSWSWSGAAAARPSSWLRSQSCSIGRCWSEGDPSKRAPSVPNLGGNPGVQAPPLPKLGGNPGTQAGL